MRIVTIGTFGKYLYKEKKNQNKPPTIQPNNSFCLSTFIDKESFFCIFLMVPITVLFLLLNLHFILSNFPGLQTFFESLTFQWQQDTVMVASYNIIIPL